MLSESDLHDALLLSYVARRVGAETVHESMTTTACMTTRCR